jgi:hypothetical protein
MIPSFKESEALPRPRNEVPLASSFIISKSTNSAKPPPQPGAEKNEQRKKNLMPLVIPQQQMPLTLKIPQQQMPLTLTIPQQQMLSMIPQQHLQLTIAQQQQQQQIPSANSVNLNTSAVAADAVIK